MAYRVIVSDDEEYICESLSRLMPMVVEGFEIVNQFSDGEEVIEYLKHNTVDVILTDIKMTFKSGIDVAKYVFENKLPTKVILLSGHQDFELARQAIQYNVTQYLLKPTDISQFRNVFEDIRYELDNQRKEDNYYNELIPLMREQFFEEVLLGVQSKDTNNAKIFSSLNNWRDSFWALSVFTSKEIDEYLQDTWKYGKGKFKDALNNIIMLFEKDFTIVSIVYHFDYIYLFWLIDKNNQTNRTITNKLLNIQDEIKDKILKVMGLEISFQNLLVFNDFTHMLNEIQVSNLEKWKKNYHDHMKNLMEVQKNIVRYVNTVEADEILVLYNSYVNQMVQDDLNNVKKYLIEFLTSIIVKVSEVNGDSLDNLDKTIQYDKGFELEDFESIINWGREELYRILNLLDRRYKISDKMIIKKIKNYMFEHCCEDISLEMVANYVYLTPVYLCQLFKRETNVNFRDYLIEVRMKKAAEYLRDPQWKIYEIAEMVGYKSIKHFNKLFKNHFGNTPSEYRKNL